MLWSECQVRSKGLGDVLVEICGKRQRGVKIEYKTPIRRWIVHKEHMVVLQNIN